MTYKVLTRTINSNTEWALMYLDIDYLKQYAEVYGYIAEDKLLKTYAALLKSAMDKGDFLGHIGESNFIILTSPAKADKLAEYLNFGFDAVSPRFYNAQDIKRGYLILDSDEKAGVRIPLVSTSIGIVSSKYRKFNNYQEALNAVINTHKLAKVQVGSSWISDRPKISAENSIEDPHSRKRKILIVESDAALAYLLTTTLEMEGYATEASNNLDEIIDIVDKSTPDLILLDAGESAPEKGLEISRLIKDNNKFAGIKIIISTIIHDKEKILDTGADLYLPKPYELTSLFGWIKRFLNSD